MKTFLTMCALAATVAGATDAQVRVAPRARTLPAEEPNSARIGVFLGENGIRDTLGVLVNSVVDGGPAAKAGVKEGDRIQSINGVNLKMTRDDAEDGSLSGMMSRRLTRELDKLKAGDNVDLRVWSGGAAKSLSVKTASAHDLDLATARPSESTREWTGDKRAALGISVGGALNKRDTLGVFVMSVADDGPAERAGIVEGDRIARINGVDLRVPSEDAGDRDLASSRMRRFTQEVGKLSAGDEVTLSVVSGGRTRDVRVKAVKASDLHSADNGGFFFGDGGFNFGNFGNFGNFEMPHIQVFPRGGDIRRFEMPDMKDFPNGTYNFGGNEKLSADIREKIDRAMEEVRKSTENIRIPSGNGYYYRGTGDEISKDVREQVQRALEKARAEIERARQDGDRVRIIRKS